MRPKKRRWCPAGNTLRPARNNPRHDRLCNVAPAVHLHRRWAVLPCKTLPFNHGRSLVANRHLYSLQGNWLVLNHPQQFVAKKPDPQIFLVRKKAGRWHHPLSSISILAFEGIISSLPPHKLGLITNSAQTPGSGYRWWWPWRIIPFSKWLVTMVIESPQHLGLFPFQMAEMAYKWGWS